MAHLVDELNLQGFDFFAWDARGHGRSPGERGHSPSLWHSVRDVQSFVEHITRQHGVREQDMHALAHGEGAVLLATWAHDYAPKVRGLTLASTALRPKRWMPFARPALAWMHKLRGLFFVNSNVAPSSLTRDAVRVASHERDPLIARPAAVNILLDLHNAAKRVLADAHAIVVPTQLLMAGADRVVHSRPQHQFFERLGCAVKEKIELAGFFHEVLGERDREPAMSAVRRFILQGFDTPAPAVDLLGADQQGATADESRALSQALHPLSPRGVYWAFRRTGLKLAGQHSHGLALGQQGGFDSGSLLDYVYRDEAQGRARGGKKLDRRFLDSLESRGIRQRQLHVQELLREAMERLAAAHREVRLMDIAAGHGRYVLDAVAASPVRAHSILLRDISEICMREGQKLIAERELQDRARFVQADALDRVSLASLMPRPTLAVVSGLYEWIPDNERVRRSLEGVGDAVLDGGYLVYTGQPWHPQLEEIARTRMRHSEGQPQVMRRRTQAEIDQLVEEAGFCKITQRIDRWGMYTVSLAQRVER